MRPPQYSISEVDPVYLTSLVTKAKWNSETQEKGGEYFDYIISTFDGKKSSLMNFMQDGSLKNRHDLADKIIDFDFLNENQIIICGEEPFVSIYFSESLSLHKKLKVSTAHSTSLSIKPFSGNDPFVAISSESGIISLVNLELEEKFYEIIGDRGLSVNQIKWRDSNTLISACENGQLKVYDSRSLAPVLILSSEKHIPLKSLDVSSTYICSGDVMGSITLYDLRNFRDDFDRSSKDLGDVKTFSVHEGEVNQVLFMNGQADYIVGCGNDASLTFISTYDSVVSHLEFSYQRLPINSIDMSQDGNSILCGCDGSILIVADYCHL